MHFPVAAVAVTPTWSFSAGSSFTAQPAGRTLMSDCHGPVAGATGVSATGVAEDTDVAASGGADCTGVLGADGIAADAGGVAEASGGVFGGGGGSLQATDATHARNSEIRIMPGG